MDPSVDALMKEKVSGVFDARFKTPARILYVGQSSSGKSSLIVSMILADERIFDQKIEQVFLFSMHYDPIYVQLEKKFGDNFRYIKDLPDNSFSDFLPDGDHKHKCIIIDDFAENAVRSESVANLFSIFSRHKNTTCLFAMQNVFVFGKNKMTLFRNATHMIIFKPSLDQSAINILAGRLFPQHSKVFHDIYRAALTKSQPYPYLCIDGSTDVADAKFRTNILDQVQNVFIPQ